MVKVKGPNFSMEEDVALTRAWVKATLDPRIGTNQTGSDFWKKVFDFFKEIYERTSEAPLHPTRSISTTTTRWKRYISPDCKVYDAILKQHPRGTGQNEEAYAASCAEIFKQQQNKRPFRFAACFEHLKDVPTFVMGAGGHQTLAEALPQELQEILDNGPPPAAAAANDPEVIGIDDDDDEDGAAVDTVNLRLERPVGVKTAKKRHMQQLANDRENRKRIDAFSKSSSDMASLGKSLEKATKREAVSKLLAMYQQLGDQANMRKYLDKLAKLVDSDEEEEAKDGDEDEDGGDNDRDGEMAPVAEVIQHDNNDNTTNNTEPSPL